MALNPRITREIASLPVRSDDVHKGDVGRVAVIGGCCDEVAMIGAPALAANAALRAGAGLVQLFVPEPIRNPVATLAPCCTLRTLPTDVDALLSAVEQFRADVVALGTGLGDSLTPEVVVGFLSRFPGPIVIDADGLNRLAEAKDAGPFPNPKRIVMTPHPGEMRRLLSSRGIDLVIEPTLPSRREAACALVEALGCTVVLKGRGTIVTDDERLYVNETGNAGMATGGTGDVLTGVIAAMIGQRLESLEASILGVYLHGLAGDFAAEELRRWSVTATDLLDYLPEAFCEHEAAVTE